MGNEFHNIKTWPNSKTPKQIKAKDNILLATRQSQAKMNNIHNAFVNTDMVLATLTWLYVLSPPNCKLLFS